MAPPTSSAELTYRRWLRQSNIRGRQTDRTIYIGDLFASHDGKSIFYVGLVTSNPEQLMSKLGQPEAPEATLEIGLIGDAESREEFNVFRSQATAYLAHKGGTPAWEPLHLVNRRFREFQEDQEATYVLASTLTNRQLENANLLEDTQTRKIALTLRRAGSILAGDLSRSAGVASDQVPKIIEKLTVAQLINKEYVVICKKSSNQVIRIDGREKLDQMARIGVLCSCGGPINDERIEELYSPKPELQTLLDQSFWMSARLVSCLADQGIAKDQILLNLQAAAEEIDAFVNVEGDLVMFELKDSEFSLGHAYPFGARIGLYRPEFAIITATKGIAPDVRAHFTRAKPSAEVLYVGSLTELNAVLISTFKRIRVRKAQSWISQFEPMAEIEIDLTGAISAQLGIPDLRAKARV